MSLVHQLLRYYQYSRTIITSSLREIVKGFTTFHSNNSSACDFFPFVSLTSQSTPLACQARQQNQASCPKRGPFQNTISVRGALVWKEFNYIRHIILSDTKLSLLYDAQ